MPITFRLLNSVYATILNDSNISAEIKEEATQIYSKFIRTPKGRDAIDKLITDCYYQLISFFN